MTIRLAKVLFAIFVVITGVSCKAEMAVTVYVGDVFDLLVSKTDRIETKAAVNIEIPSADSKEQMLGVLKDYFKTMENEKIVSRDMNTYLSFNTTFPIVYIKDGSGPRNIEDLMYLVVVTIDSPNPIIEIGLNKGSLAKLNAYIKEKYYQSITIEEMIITLIINNDTSKECKVVAQASYVNEKPKPFAAETKIKKREEVTIRLSDVLRDSLKNDELVAIALLKSQ
jgi:hypothetical protein